MGVNQLWKLLDGVLERRSGGGSAEEYAELVREVDGKAVAVDLSMWAMQADQQQALLPHYSREERCIKVAFERALQWLRHGCLPVIVVEGRAPEEKREAQQQRLAQRTGRAPSGAHSGGGQRESQWTRLGRLVASVLEALGLPVFYAPGEAEAVCAALAQAGCVDAVATFDSDVLLYGAETVYQTLRLSTTQPGTCELVKCSMGAVREALGIALGGPGALSIIALLAGCDFDLDGAQGVGSIGGLALAQHLLQGAQDDDCILDRLAQLLQRPPDEHLLSLAKCTGCQQCGHEGGRRSRIKRHTAQNPCPRCPPSQDGACCAAQRSVRCGCEFHSTEAERRVERIAERVRRDPAFLQEAEASLGVFVEQGRQAAEYVVARLQELGTPLGHKLGWRHRPSVSRVWDILQARCPGLLWDLPALRAKLLPVLLEWDMAHPGPQAEFSAAEVQKVHGQKGRGDAASPAHWRYVLRWERAALDLEGLGTLQVRPKKPRARRGEAAAAAAGGGEADDSDPLLSQPFSQPLSQPLSQQQRFLGSPGQPGQVLSQQQSWGMELGTQLAAGEGASQEPAPEPMSVPQFDKRWLKEQPAEHRAVRRSAVERLCPRLVEAYKAKLAAPAGGRKSKAAGAAAAGSSAGGGTDGGRQKGGGRGSKAGPAPAGAAAAAEGGDILQMFGNAGQRQTPATAAKPAAPPRRYGLGPAAGQRSGAAGQRSAAEAGPSQTPQQQQEQPQKPLGRLRAARQAAQAGGRLAGRAAAGGAAGAESGAARTAHHAVKGSPGAGVFGGAMLPPSPATMLSLLSSVLGPPSPGTAAHATAAEAGGPAALSSQQAQQQQQQEEVLEGGAAEEEALLGSDEEGGPAAYESPSKRRRVLPTTPSSRGYDSFELLLSPGSIPGLTPPGSARPGARGQEPSAAGTSRQLFGPGRGAGPQQPQQAQHQTQHAQQARQDGSEWEPTGASSGSGSPPAAARHLQTNEALAAVGRWLEQQDSKGAPPAGAAAASAIPLQNHPPIPHHNHHHHHHHHQQQQQQGDRSEQEGVAAAPAGEGPGPQSPGGGAEAAHPLQPAPMLQHWRLPQKGGDGGGRRLRVQSQRGQGGGTGGSGAQGTRPAATAAAAAPAAQPLQEQRQQPQRAGGPAAAQQAGRAAAKAPRRGKAGLRTAARGAVDIRSFLHKQAVAPAEEEPTGADPGPSPEGASGASLERAQVSSRRGLGAGLLPTADTGEAASAGAEPTGIGAARCARWASLMATRGPEGPRFPTAAAPEAAARSAGGAAQHAAGAACGAGRQGGAPAEGGPGGDGDGFGTPRAAGTAAAGEVEVVDLLTPPSQGGQHAEQGQRAQQGGGTSPERPSSTLIDLTGDDD